MKLFKTTSVLSAFVTMQTSITIIKINTINIINLQKNAPKLLLFNLETLKFFQQSQFYCNSYHSTPNCLKKIPHTKNWSQKKRKSETLFMSTIFYQIFIFSPNDSPLKTMKSVKFFVIFSLSFYTFQIQTEKWECNNLCHKFMSWLA